MGYYISIISTHGGDGKSPYLNVHEIVCFSGDKNGTKVYLTNGQSFDISYGVAELKEIIEKSGSKFHSSME